MTRRFLTPILPLCAAVSVACGSDKVLGPPAPATVELTPPGASILQGGSITVDVVAWHSDGSTGAVNLTVTDLPTGVAAILSNVQTPGFATSATLTLNVSSSTIPGVYSLVMHGTGTGVAEGTATFALTVESIASVCPGGSACEQWATTATASSQYTATDWSANQATGQPNVPGSVCTDDPHAWSSLNGDGAEWLELAYGLSVLPTEIQVYEVSGASSIVKVEVKDEAGTYYTVYTAQPGTQTCPRVLTIPVSGISAKVRVVRLSFDESVVNLSDEIDAVKLIGNP